MPLKYNQVSVGAVAVPLSVPLVSETRWVLKAAAANAQPVYIGDVNVTTGTGFPLQPGEALTYGGAEMPGKQFDLTPDQVYVIGTPGDSVAWDARLGAFTLSVPVQVALPTNMVLSAAGVAPNQRVTLQAAVTKEAPVNPKHTDFAGGAKFNDSTDDTAALNAAITYAKTVAANGGTAELLIPSGTAKVTARLQLGSANGLKIRGEGEQASFIKQYTNNEPIIEWSSAAGVSHNRVSDLNLAYATQQTVASHLSSAGVRLLTTLGTSGFFYNTFENVVIDKATWGIGWNGTSPYTDCSFWGNTLNSVITTNISGSVLSRGMGTQKWRQQWVVGTTYAQYDLVYHIGTGAYYVSKAAGNVGNVPVLGGTVWWAQITLLGSPVNICNKLEHIGTGGTPGAWPAVDLGYQSEWQFNALDLEDWQDTLVHAFGAGTGIGIHGAHIERHTVATPDIAIFDIGEDSSQRVDNLELQANINIGNPNRAVVFRGRASVVPPSRGARGVIENLKINYIDSTTTGNGILEIFDFDFPPSHFEIGARWHPTAASSSGATIVDWQTANTPILRAVTADRGLPPQWDSGTPLPVASALYRGRKLFVSAAATSIPDKLVTCRQISNSGAATYAWLPDHGGYFAPVYGVTVAIDFQNGEFQRVLVTDNVAYTIATPTNMDGGRLLVIDIANSSGGALTNPITWGAGYNLAGAFTNPGSGKHRTITFFCSGANLYELCRAAADI